MTSEAPDEDVLKFAKTLVNPEKSLRDKTLVSLRSYISKETTFDEITMLKLWKALYYCMWLADKAPIQEELADSLTGLIVILQTEEYSFLYIRMFFRIFLREWFHLDQYRVNKMYMLIRKMLNKAFQYVLGDHNNHRRESSPTTRINTLASIITEESFTKIPNGVRFHIADIFLPELYSATQGSLNTALFMQMSQPFLDALLRNDDRIFMDRIEKAFFETFAEKFAVEVQSEETGGTQFTSVKTAVLQKAIFDLAATETTSGGSRKRLYAAHKIISTASGKDFITSDDIETTATDGSTKKSKKAKKTAVEAVERISAAAIVEPTSKTPISASKKKADKISTMEADAEVPSKKRTKAMEAEANITATTTSTTKVAAVETPAETTSSKKRKQSQVKQATNSAESTAQEASVKSALKSTKSEVEKPSNVDFLPSKKFAGAKSGFVFRNGGNGVGYYKDKPPQRSVSFAAKQQTKTFVNHTSIGGGKRQKRR